MGLLERAFNVLTGLSVLSWGVLGIVLSPEPERFAVPRIFVSVLHLSVGCLLLVRRKISRQPSLLDVILSLPSMILCGVVFKLSLPLSAWPVHATAVFGAGTVWTTVSMLFLGRNFAVLPAVRGISQSGPYRLVRHPAYLGEIVMFTGCVLAGPELLTIILFGVLVPCMVVRILVEEMLLSGDEYDDYRSRVRRRLLPGIW